MTFSTLERMHKKWRDILVIGKTIERNNRKYHIVGMTLDDEAKLYVIEPYHKQEYCGSRRKRNYNQRRILKEQTESDVCYLHCSDFYLGNKRLRIQGGSGSCLKYSLQDYGEIQLFLDMMSAGWTVPEWLKSLEWDHIQLVTLEIEDMKRLPKYSTEMPITIKHDPVPMRHILEKTVTLQIGKRRSFRFVDSYGDTVQCYINNVTLIDVWKATEERFCNPEYVKRFSAEQLQEIKKHCYEALEQSCPEGMCYIGIEYECTKDLSLQFYSKQYLKSYPQEQKGSSSVMLMRLKPDHETGIHNLPLKGCVIQTAVLPDTSEIPAELFLYFEKAEPWEEQV